MKIKLHGEIVDAATKEMQTKWWGVGENSVSYNDIDEALASKAEDDKQIDVSINCPGGNCIEGMAIYDKFRSMEGCTITMEVFGECSSMATIVLLSGSKRAAHPNARFCIHKPRFMDFYAPMITEDDALRMHDDLQAEKKRMNKIYLERTNMTEEQLEALMSEDRYITAEEALQYGVITEIIQPMTAIKQPNKKAMNLTRAQRVALRAVGLGDCIEKIEAMQDNAAVAMTLNTEDGSTIKIEREEGEPQVGDKAVNTKDGEYKMADGTTIVIADGVITEIKPAETKEDETMTEEEVASTIAEMTEAIEKLTAENEDLKKQLNASKANEKTAEDSKVLQLVANAGGLKWLESLKSNHKPASREVKTANKTTSEETVAEIRKKYEQTKNKH